MLYGRIILACTALMWLGCGGDEERLKMKRDIANIQEQIYQIERNQKELSDKMDDTVSQIQEKMEERRMQADQADQVATLQESLYQLEARITDMEGKLSSVGQTPVGTITTTPTTDSGATASSISNSDLEIQFNTSYGDFTRGKYELAAYGFEEMLNNFPNSPFSEQCHYYLGRSYFELKQWQKANLHFDAIVANFQQGTYLRPAMLYQGQCFYYMNSHSRAISRLQELINKFPDSQEAKLAKTFSQKAGYEK